jgi:hypothetical protein
MRRLCFGESRKQPRDCSRVCALKLIGSTYNALSTNWNGAW